MARLRLLAFAAWLLCAASLLPAAEPAGFLGTLSAEQRTTAGLDHLSTAEQTALNTLVAREVAFARQGKVRAFAGTFATRRHGTEAQAAGLDRLTPEEQARLDDYVSAALAAGPVKPEPKELPARAVTGGNRLQIHGSISLALGWGGGGSFRAGSIDTDIYDPDTGLHLSLGVGEFSGKGWWPCAAGYPRYDPSLSDSPLSFPTDFRGDWNSAFRPQMLHGSSDYFRRH